MRWLLMDTSGSECNRGGVRKRTQDAHFLRHCR